MQTKKSLLVSLSIVLCVSPLFGQTNGKLQIHFMDVGQGDGTVLISPQGEVVLFDNGVRNNSDKPGNYQTNHGTGTDTEEPYSRVFTLDEF